MTTVREYITQEESRKYILDMEDALLNLLTSATNEFLTNYIDPKYNEPKNIFKAAAVKIIRHWGRDYSNLKAITDIDVHMQFDTKWSDYSIPPEVEAMISAYKAEDANSTSNSFSFL
ncbi:MAG: hypothetical protein ACRC23_01595 [Aeromonas jandaei]